MAQTIKIKRSTTTATPSTLSAGELAYSDNSDKLFIGAPADSAVVAIGGKVYVDMLDHTAGTLTANSAVVVDANKKINEFLVANIEIAKDTETNKIATSSGNLVLEPAADLRISAGTINLNAQATEFKLTDNSATAGTFATADHTYLTFDTTNSAEKVKFGRQVEFSGAYTLPTSDGTAGQALITDGSGAVTFTDVSTTLTIDATDDSTSADVDLLTDDLQFTGGEGIDLTVAKSGTDVTVTIDAEDATTSNKGVASFDTANFTVTNGAVSAKGATSSAAGILRPTAGLGIDVFFEANNTVEIQAEIATETNHGVATFDGTNFTVTSGDVTSNAITLGSTSINLGGTHTAIAGLTQVDVDNIRVNGNEISSTNTNGDISLNPNGTGAIDANNAVIKNLATPTSANHAATKGYVDGVKQSLDIKDSVRVATTANITISTALNVGDTIDGVTLADGDRVLVKNQTAGSENGIYTAGATPARSADANASAEVTSGMFVFVEEGTVNADQGFVLTTDGTITLDTTALTFTQFSGAGQITAGDALSKTGNTLDVEVDDKTIQVSGDALRIKGITQTAIGDLLIGAATNGGYTRLAKPSSDDAFLTMGTAGTASWTTTLDGGTF